MSSNISETLKTSLSGIIGSSTVEKLEEYKLFDTALNGDALSTIENDKDAASLDQEELLEIIGILEGQLSTAEGAEVDAIEQAIKEIYASIEGQEEADKRTVDENQKIDIDNDGIDEDQQLGAYLNDPANQIQLKTEFSGLDDQDLQIDILKHYYNQGNFDLIQELLADVGHEEASDLILQVAEDA